LIAEIIYISEKQVTHSMDEALKIVADELIDIKPYLSSDYEQVKKDLAAKNYVPISFWSKISPWSWGTKLDMKRKIDTGRFQIRLFKNGRGRIDIDFYDPERSLANAILHPLIDGTYFITSELHILNLAKNNIEFKY